MVSQKITESFIVSPLIVRGRGSRANQMHLILRTAAYWLLHILRTTALKHSVCAQVEFGNVLAMTITWPAAQQLLVWFA